MTLIFYRKTYSRDKYKQSWPEFTSLEEDKELRNIA